MFESLCLISILIKVSLNFFAIKSIILIKKTYSNNLESSLYTDRLFINPIIKLLISTNPLITDLIMGTLILFNVNVASMSFYYDNY